MLIDSHCHLNMLNLDEYEGDLSAMMKVAFEKIEYVLNVCVDLDGAKDVIATAEKFPNVGASVGIHPSEKLEVEPTAEEIIKLASHDKVIAIGEGGEDAELSERKWIKTEGKVDAAYIAVYPPKCAIISLASANYPTAVVIESKEVATAQKIIFDTLWGLL